MGTGTIRDIDLNIRAREVCRNLRETMPEGFGNRAGDAVRNLFAEYEKAFSALDLEGSERLFADTLISAGPGGVIAQGRSEFMKLAHRTALFYRSAGLISAKILSLQETPVSNEYALVNVHWGVTFRKSPDRPIEFDVSYIVQKSDPGPRIILSISHQGEGTAMKDFRNQGEAVGMVGSQQT